MSRRTYSQVGLHMDISSPFNCRQCNKNPHSSTFFENGPAGKGDTHSLHGEFFVMESDEGEDREPEAPSKEKRFKRDGLGHKGMKIVTSVTINENDVFPSQVVFQQSHELEHRSCASSGAAVTTTKIKCVGSNVKIEIKEVLHSGQSDIETTFVVQEKREKRKEASFKNQSWNSIFSLNNEKLNHTYSSSQSASTYREGGTCECYEFSITKTDTDSKEVTKDTVGTKHHEESRCCKSCCEDKFHNFHLYRHGGTYPKARDGTCRPQPFQLYSQGSDIPSRYTVFNEVFSDIPPPREFADRNCRSLEDLTQDVASCHIGLSDTFDEQGGRPSSLGESEGTRYDVSSSHQFSVDGDNYATGLFFQQQSDSDTYDTFFLDPKMIKSRSSFTKDFIHNHEGKTWLRNNSIAIIETKPRASYFLDKQSRRRKTFPSMEDCSTKMPESLPLHRESISSGTISPFFMQPLALQATRSGQIYMEDERPFTFYAERRKSSESNNSYKPTFSHFSDHNTFLPNPFSYDKITNSQVKSEELLLSDFVRYNQQEQTLHNNMETSDIKYESNSHVDAGDRDSCSAGPVDQSEVAESGFDEEMADAEDHAEAFAEEHAQRNLLIHVIPPSRSTSQDFFSEDSITLSKIPRQEITGSSSAPRRRGGSVVTVITGGCEQRCLQNDPEGLQEDVCSTVYGRPSVSPILDVDDVDLASNSDIPVEAKTPLPTALTTDTNTPSKAKIMIVCSSGEQETEIGRKTSIRIKNEETMAQTETPCCTPVLQEKLNKDATMLHEKNSAENRNVPTAPVDVKVEVKEHLKPPDAVLKDQEDAPDRWAKRRKLFKESRQWSSAGGSSITSNITEESMNSEDNRSMDLSMRDIEDRGFYTETFHSASWIFRGDDVHPKDSPRCLSNRTRPVTIRERTVKISKGVGDYPWGFRIQYSKPIVVTEVDTNGAAEEAGLQVGDYVLSVNGTDVTRVPHSEAADLARQGPDLLTLTIGSDISRLPNTPRPACRGYLHKRTQSGFLKGWRKRWFVLKHDCCLYYYRHKKDEGKTAALSSIKLEGAEVGPDTNLGKPFVFKCSPLSANRVYYFCATSNQEMKRWLEAMERAVHPVTQNHVWIDVTRHNSNLPPLAIKNPECLGLLHQMDRINDAWVQHYCILKDGCLYFYASIRSTYALGGIFLHGYTVKEQPFASKRSTIELKPPSEEFKTFYVCAENATENKRWISALKASISKWLPLHQAIQDFMNRPPEETRM